MAAYLDKQGLSKAWAKIKNYLKGANIATSVVSGQTTVDGALGSIIDTLGLKADKSATYTKQEVDSLVASLFRYKGTKSTFAEVEAETNKAVGDVWFVSADHSEYAWDGTKWEKLGPEIDMSPYMTNISIAGLNITSSNSSITAAQLIAAIGVYTKTEVDNALAGKKSKQSAVADPSASGTSVTFISGISQNENGIISPSKKTVSTMGAASSSAAGTAGLVPAPAAGKQAQFLRGDGTWQTPTDTDTKNTAGSTDSSSKLFLIGATSQAANPQTYSHDTAYVGTDGCLYSDGKKVLSETRKINGKALSADVTLNADDIAQSAIAETGVATVNDALSYQSQQIDNLHKRTRKNITNNLANLPAAIAEQNLQKYGYDIGDYFVAGGYTYTLADLNTFYGEYSSHGVVNIKHITIVVDANTNVQWNTSNTTATGYVGSNLHAYLVDTVLPNVKSHIQSLFGDSWENHLIKHAKLYRTGESKWAWGWSTDQYISALTSVQLHGSPICDMDGTDTGEGNKPLEVFQKFFYPEILGSQNTWLRSVSAAGYPCRADASGAAFGVDGASTSLGAVGLIIFK